MIDAHAHLLPGVDDGSPSWEVTMQMARQAAEDGIRHIICTPHMNAEADGLAPLKRHMELLDEFRGRLLAEGIGISLDRGAEWMLTPDLVDVVSRQGRLGQGRAFLYELSPFMPMAAAGGILRSAKKAGLIPVLAHPERYPSMNEKEIPLLGEFTARGCVLQITAGSLLGVFGRDAKRLAEAIALAHPQSIVLSTDAHNTGPRSPKLRAAYAALDALQPGLANAAQQKLKILLA